MPRLRLTLEPPLYIWRASRVRGDSRFDHPSSGSGWSPGSENEQQRSVIDLDDFELLLVNLNLIYI